MKTTYQVNIREVESANADESRLFKTVATTESMTSAKAIAELITCPAEDRKFYLFSDKMDPTKVYEVEIVTVVDGLAESVEYIGYANIKTGLPNGFQSWTEAHYEVTAAITRAVDSGNYGKAIAETMEKEGFTGLRDLAVDLANEFERENEGREWDGDFLESIWDFMGKKLA